MRKLLIALGLWAMGYGLLVAEQRIEPIPFGNMDEWIVRYLKESKILGGHTKTLYTLGATDTIRENGAYLAADNNPWGCSDTYAKCFGVETAMSGSVVPEPRGYGYCCRLRNILSRIDIGGDIYAMVSGTIYMGHALEPLGLQAKHKPFTAIDFGTQFTQHPVALMLDYKATISDIDTIISTAHNKPEKIAGHDCAVIYVYLQHRWEDKETGRIYARRVGTIYERICETIPEWINNHQLPIRWGDISDDPDFQEYEGLNRVDLMTRNSKGRMVKIEEIGWSKDEPTHIVMYISSSNAGVFRACEGNTLWVDNLRWVFEEEDK
jgi:hypothetical protein